MSDSTLGTITRRNYWLNAVLLAGLVTVFVTGELRGRAPWHQLLAGSLAAGLALHLVWHWAALVRVPTRVLGRARTPGRDLAIVDLVLVVLLVLTVVSGIVMSPWVSDDPGHIWMHLHHVLPKVMLVGAAVHLVQHRAWIARVTRQVLGTPVRRSDPTP